MTGCSSLSLTAKESQPFSDTDHTYRFLTEEDRIIVAAIAPVMLAGALPSGSRDKLREVVRGVDYAISLLTDATREELRDLFGVLGNASGRVVLAGVWSHWSHARPNDIEEFLDEWRGAYLDLLRQGYLGLHELIMAAWYGNPASWEAVGYPGPPRI